MSNHQTEHNTYLKHDLLVLLTLGVIIGGVLAALWYLESTGARFSQFASSLLDSGAR
jgi:hypothetical protein